MNVMRGIVKLLQECGYGPIAPPKELAQIRELSVEVEERMLEQPRLTVSVKWSE